MKSPKPLRIAATGFVEAGAGSMASANAILLRELLRSGHEVVFFSKSSFVDPRPLFPEGDPHRKKFSFVEANNRLTDRTRRCAEKLPLLGLLFRQIDSRMYYRTLLRTITAAHRNAKFDVVLWFGDYARGRIAGLPSVSFAQGPPGTDARSILRHWSTIRSLAHPLVAWRWRILAALRQSRLGLPPFAASDRILVGSQQSARTLQTLYGIPSGRIDSLPYPIDLELFRPLEEEIGAKQSALPRSLRVLWLGRIIPRKRLDLFLDGAALAIRRGLDLRLTVVGSCSMFPGYLKMIAAFPFPERLEYREQIDRASVPELFARKDVLVQPSEEEDFGSSVAEAQACGLPVVVGRTNGNADYLASRDVCLPDDQPESLADAFHQLAHLPANAWSEGRRESRQFAETQYSPEAVAAKLQTVLQKAVGGNRKNLSD